MEIHVIFNAGNPVRLFAMDALKKLKDATDLYYRDKGLRHPYSAFSMVSNELIDSTIDLIDLIEEYVATFDGEKKGESPLNRRIRRATDQFIDAQAEFYDACLSCIISMFPEGSKEAGRETRVFKDSTREYSRRVMVQANYIKHRHSKVVNMVQFAGQVIIPGYFIESAQSHGGMGPSADIHNKYHGMHTAFSYNREIRLALIGLLHVSQKLNERIGKIKSLTLEPDFDEVGAEKLKALIRRVEKLPNYVYSDEATKSLPIVEVSDDEIVIKFDKLKSGHRKELLWSRVHLMSEVDPVSKSFTLPYFRGR